MTEKLGAPSAREGYPWNGHRVAYEASDDLRDIRLMKPVGRASQKREKAAKELREWKALVRHVRERDGYRCRVCKRRAFMLDPHHIVFRSAGGKDTKENLILCCRADHDQIHAGRIFVSGNGEGTIRIER